MKDTITHYKTKQVVSYKDITKQVEKKFENFYSIAFSDNLFRG